MEASNLESWWEIMMNAVHYSFNLLNLYLLEINKNPVTLFIELRLHRSQTYSDSEY